VDQRSSRSFGACRDLCQLTPGRSLVAHQGRQATGRKGCWLGRAIDFRERGRIGRFVAGLHRGILNRAWRWGQGAFCRVIYSTVVILEEARVLWVKSCARLAMLSRRFGPKRESQVHPLFEAAPECCVKEG
jgi:hypothetical protein